MRFPELTGQFYVGQALVEHLADQFTGSFPIARRLAIVEPKGLLVEIPEQMEGFDAHIGSLESALKQIPEAFKIVGMNVSVRILDGVVNDRVLVVGVQAFIGQQLICEDSRARFYVVTHLLLQFFLSSALYYLRANPAATLHESHNYGLIFAASAGNYPFALVFVHESRKTTDHAFVNFDLARQFAAFLILHCESDAMEHEPRGFLSNADGAMNLPRTNSVPIVRDHPHSGQPLVETKRTILEDRAGLNGELAAVVALIALPAIVLFLKGYIVASATRTDHTVTPATGYYVLAAVNRIGEINNRFLKGSRLHDSDYDSDRWSCQVYSYPN